MTRISQLALCLAATSFWPINAHAAEAVEFDSSLEAIAEEPSGSGDGWDVAFTPYLWVAGTKGDIGIPKGSGEVEIDKSFTDTLSSLDFAFMGALDVHHDRFVFIGDIIYLDVGAKAEGIRDPQFVSGRIDASTLVTSAAVGYRVVDKGPMFLDLFAGGRLIALDVDIDLEGPLAMRSADASATTVAPLVGARFRAPLGPGWALGLYGDVGGIVKGADVKWQAMANIQHDISSHWRVIAGYRYMAINHDTDRFEFDVNLSGPIFGVSYRF